VLFTWYRLFLGMDLRDESFSIVVPWRWALGDTPFVDEQNLAQIPSLLIYPFVKVFGLVRGYDPTGLILYTRHLYLLMMIGAALAAFFALRRLVRWELAVVVSSVFVSYVFFAITQLCYNTMGAAFLVVGSAFGLRVVVEGRGRGWALASGVAFGLAVVAFPTLLFIMPFVAIFFVFAQGRRAVGMVAEGAFVHPPDPDGVPTGRQAWRTLSFWVLGGLLVVVPAGLFILSFGVQSLVRCWEFTMTTARKVSQFGGAAKAVSVAEGAWWFLRSHLSFVLAALVIYLVYRRWPRLGRSLLCTLPVALWLSSQALYAQAAGFMPLFALLPPYLLLFVPVEKRRAGAKLLIFVWAPSIVAGAMTAYTSAEGYTHAPVGLFPVVMAGGLFLAWALESVSGPPRSRDAQSCGERSSPRLPWLALVVLIAVVGVTISLQFQHQVRDVPYAQLTERCDFGPWSGIMLAPQRDRLLREVDVDLRAQARPGDKLLILWERSGFYLVWNGAIAANSYWISNLDTMGPLPQSTVDYYRRHHEVPTLVLHFLDTEGVSPSALQAGCGGLGYPAVLVRPRYALQRKPADETTDEVLARLPK